MTARAHGPSGEIMSARKMRLIPEDPKAASVVRGESLRGNGVEEQKVLEEPQRHGMRPPRTAAVKIAGQGPRLLETHGATASTFTEGRELPSGRQRGQNADGSVLAKPTTPRRSRRRAGKNPAMT